VKLYSAAESQSALSFNQINKKDGARVKQQLVSSRSGEVVPREDIVKGYEFSKGQYVLFEPDELKALEATATHTVDIVEFLKAEQIERRYLEKVYFLGPDKGGARAYKLLSMALAETGRVGIGKYAARGKQYLVMVRPMGEGLVLKLAVQLIEQAASDEFKPESYTDEVRERMLALIQKKVEGEDITVAPTAEPEHKIVDIMEALKASLAAGSSRKPAQAADKKAKAKASSEKTERPAAKKRAAAK
jgi:DNA end-binding protein Ku